MQLLGFNVADDNFVRGNGVKPDERGERVNKPNEKTSVSKKIFLIIGLSFASCMALGFLIQLTMTPEERAKMSAERDAERAEKESARTTSMAASAAAKKAELGFPAEQEQFFALNKACYEAFRQGKNEIQKSMSFNSCNAQRAEFAAQNQISNWTGVITSISTDQGADVVTLGIAAEIDEFQIQFTTVNNRFSDMFTNSMITQQNPLFNVLAQMEEGGKVNFSATFLKDPTGNHRIWEGAMTESGSMSEPEFQVRFSDIRLFGSIAFASTDIAPPVPSQMNSALANTQDMRGGDDAWTPPKFAEYPVSRIYSGPPAELVMDNDTARDYRTQFNENLNRYPDFAGEYIGVQWGCGTQCVSQHLINKRTGKVLADGFGGECGETIEAMRVESRLIVTKGPVCDDNYNEIDYKVRFYLLEGESLELIKEKSIPKPVDE